MPKKMLSGIVVSNKQDKTIVVKVMRQVRHPLYKKIIRKSKRYLAHDETNSFNIGDNVKIQECKPYSKKKTWLVVNKNFNENKKEKEQSKQKGIN